MRLANGLLPHHSPDVNVVSTHAEVCNGMKVRIVLRVSTVKPEISLDERCRNFRHMLCRMSGHREEFDLSTGRLALKCSRCGWKSQGWKLDQRPPLRTV